MLTLTRRETEKILFPSLGISVVVVSVQGKKVRLGIDAPEEILVLRGEIEKHGISELTPAGTSTGNLADLTATNSTENSTLTAVASLEQHPALPLPSAPREVTQSQPSESSPPQIQRVFPTAVQRDSSLNYRKIQKCLDAANLAIHLAQNQLRQQLSNNAEIALENALECLDRLEQTVASSGTSRESGSGDPASDRGPVASGMEALPFDYGTRREAAINPDAGVVRESATRYTTTAISQPAEDGPPPTSPLIARGQSRNLWGNSQPALACWATNAWC